MMRRHSPPHSRESSGYCSSAPTRSIVRVAGWLSTRRRSRRRRKPVAVIQVPAEGLIHGMVEHGVPEPVALLLASFDANTRAGGLADVTGDFKALTGVEPLGFPEWLTAHKSAI